MSQSSQGGQSGKSKELKTTSKQVISPSVLKEDKRKLQLLYIIKTLDGVTERALITLLYEGVQKGLDMGYQFNVIGNNVFSPAVKEDLTSLLYLGYLENDPVTKKLKLTNDGEEAFQANKSSLEESFISSVNQAISELKSKIVSIDQEYSMKLRSERRKRR
ncbi:MAG: hypothetical protein RXS23_07535 [Metallosphaera yellowstonensis]|jgi:hypothetical protein|uniref:Uncharacterized protein n=1 Tax=Metallosphaera yellowstonensis MK1 TaxID=671065 RepID=H2C6A8_9CREN|nr:hypothetical protein [Metallosphaera yellowstonensis]EHP69335.1 hypothetical protein MetMK1DRAFT_00020850 [Metallosphaera yellowstonensis MK1]